MRKFKFVLSAMLLMFLGSCFTSCSKDDKPVDDSNPLAGTRWEYVDRFSESGVSYELTYSLNFSDYDAYYTLEYVATSGSQTLTDSESISYSYSYSDPLVVLSPRESGKAYLEGTISSGIKMIVKNTSTGKTIGTFYKQ